MSRWDMIAEIVYRGNKGQIARETIERTIMIHVWQYNDYTDDELRRLMTALVVSASS